MEERVFSTQWIAQRTACAAAALILMVAAPCRAQVTTAAGYTPPDDTPSVKVGVTIFTDFTEQQQPKITDTDGNSVKLSNFNVSRSYINVTGNISHSISFRITPDITRETDPADPAGTLNGSYVFRLKYAFAQWNLDDYMTKGSWARFGQQQTPYVDYSEGVYRYRFQGTTFAEREGYLSSSDVGASFHYNLPSNYGEIHAGVYNGENYAKPEVNNEKGYELCGTLRPFAKSSMLPARGLKITAFVNHDLYVKNADRQREIVAITFEHTYLNASFEYLAAKDQTSVTKAAANARGWSTWFTPRSTIGWEGLFRYDHLEPNTTVPNQLHQRMIAGVSYWFPHQGSVSTALLIDVDNATFDNFTPAQPTQRKFAVHALVNF
jgi:hypothetical protein